MHGYLRRHLLLLIIIKFLDLCKLRQTEGRTDAWELHYNGILD
jgi:hypothetical protein